jgi:hypothetical protein
MTDEEELGPVDVVVIGFPPGAPMTGESVPILLDLVDRGIIRVFDARFIKKEEDGTFSGFDIADLDEDTAGEITAFTGASSGLLGEEDIALAANEMPAGSAAVMIVYENRWAAQFAASVRRNGGELIAFERIRTSDLIEALDAVEAAA